MFNFRKAIALAGLFATAAAFIASPMYGAAKLALTYSDPFHITEYRLRGLTNEQYVGEVEEAIHDGDFDDAARIIEIAEERGHRFAPELVASVQEDTTARTLRYAKDLATGFATGDASSPASIVGAMAADYLIIGDLRDIAIEGPKAVSGQDYDKFVLGLALVGVVTLAPGTGPIDAGVSIMKTAKRAGNLSAGLMRSLGRSASRLIDLGALKSAMSSSSGTVIRMPAFAELSRILRKVSITDTKNPDFSAFRKAAADLVPVDMAAIKRRFSGVLRPTATKEISRFTSATAAIAQKGGVKAAFRSLKLADNSAELARFGKLASRTGDRTSSVIRLLGKGAIYLGDLIYSVIAALLYAVAWLVSAVWAVLSFLFNLRSVFR